MERNNFLGKCSTSLNKSFWKEKFLMSDVFAWSPKKVNDSNQQMILKDWDVKSLIRKKLKKTKLIKWSLYFPLVAGRGITQTFSLLRHHRDAHICCYGLRLILKQTDDNKLR